MSWIKELTPSQKRREREVDAAASYLWECLQTFSDKKIVWLAEKCSEIDSYKKKDVS